MEANRNRLGIRFGRPSLHSTLQIYIVRGSIERISATAADKVGVKQSNRQQRTDAEQWKKKKKGIVCVFQTSSNVLNRMSAEIALTAGRQQQEMIGRRQKLTDDIQSNELAAVRLGGYLTFVQSGVSGLREFDLQRPVLGRTRLDNAEPLVGRVRVSTDRQDVDVTVSDPAHLKRKQRRGNFHYSSKTSHWIPQPILRCPSLGRAKTVCHQLLGSFSRWMRPRTMTITFCPKLHSERHAPLFLTYFSLARYWRLLRRHSTASEHPSVGKSPCRVAFEWVARPNEAQNGIRG